MKGKQMQRMGLPRRMWLLLGVAAVVAIVVFAGRWFGQPASAPTGATEKPSSGVFKPTKQQWANLKETEVRRSPFRSTVATDGAIAFNEDALTPVFSPYSGRVVKLIAKPGDVVAKGDPLLVVDAAEFVQAASDLSVAVANLATVQATEKRQRELFAAGASAEKDLRQAQADLATAEAALSAVRGRLRILGKNESDIDLLGKNRSANGEAVIAAPIAGTVTQRQVGLGQYIVSAAAGAANPVFTIGELSTVWLIANVRESEIPRVKVGQSAEVTALALPNQTFTGKVAWIGPAVDAATHRLPVRIAVKNPDGVLKPQMFASFSIATSAATLSPAVPESAVMHDGDTTRVFKVSADGTVASQAVSIGRTVGGMVEVLDGLAAGDKVIAAGTLFIDRATAPD